MKQTNNLSQVFLAALGLQSIATVMRMPRDGKAGPTALGRPDSTPGCLGLDAAGAKTYDGHKSTRPKYARRCSVSPLSRRQDPGVWPF
jgi:hypothetical protein